MPTITQDTPTGDTAELRAALVDELRADGKITDPAVAAAFQQVPRHAFAPPGTSPQAAYDAWKAVITKHDEHGRAVSSISAPFIQARMIEQGGLTAGMRVLEIGSGGYNAALLAEVVGPQGQVVSVDIDPDVTSRAEQLLQATGYGDRVSVVCADGNSVVPGADFDAILVTVGAWDIAPAWLARLRPAGRLVLPLVMNGITRSIGFRREDDHLVSTSAEVCGFVPMQGDGARAERVLLFHDAQQNPVRLRFDAGLPTDLHRLDAVMATGPTTAWSGVSFPWGESHADLTLWCASHLPHFCQISAEAAPLGAEPQRWFPYGVVDAGHQDSFAYLTTQTLPNRDDGVEFGARGFGPHAEAATTELIDQIRAWDQTARPGPAPTFSYWPTGTGPDRFPDDTAVLPKDHGRVTISWPAPD